VLGAAMVDTIPSRSPGDVELRATPSA
jgi:hypothetical protein